MKDVQYSRGAPRRYVKIIIACSCLYDGNRHKSHSTCHVQELITILIVVYFSQVKINHVSHEFILEFGTVANTFPPPMLNRKSRY
jgi:hypothetical protein